VERWSAYLAKKFHPIASTPAISPLLGLS
jgi:hypothetical protein